MRGMTLQAKLVRYMVPFPPVPYEDVVVFRVYEVPLELDTLDFNTIRYLLLRQISEDSKPWATLLPPPERITIALAKGIVDVYALYGDRLVAAAFPALYTDILATIENGRIVLHTRIDDSDVEAAVKRITENLYLDRYIVMDWAEFKLRQILEQRVFL